MDLVDIITNKVKEIHISEKIIKFKDDLEYIDNVKKIDDEIKNIKFELSYYMKYIKYRNGKFIIGEKAKDLMVELTKFSHNNYNNDFKLYNYNKNINNYPYSIPEKIAIDKIEELKIKLNKLFMEKDKLYYYYSNKC